ncbi:hypothetical protein HNQ34_001163 [Anoxybacillus tepidamans]|uniref:Uncharacterized protein n=1 Tax=Anoxybacteroides tepidamans TaxID=265948 RepID=A0A7W8MVA2_9BACL|nr:hypothetical protein [Anoxybacillus tepidamans]MBB5324071.1 hypothetical protein [Anoxybacillus tepidamans]
MKELLLSSVLGLACNVQSQSHVYPLSITRLKQALSFVKQIFLYGKMEGNNEDETEWM